MKSRDKLITYSSRSRCRFAVIVVRIQSFRFRFDAHVFRLEIIFTTYILIILLCNYNDNELIKNIKMGLNFNFYHLRTKGRRAVKLSTVLAGS